VTEANNKMLAMQREKEMKAAENFAASAVDETYEQMDEQDNTIA
jgi:hypothetical protein